MTRERRTQFAVQLELGVEAQPERPKPKRGRQVSGGGSWLQRCSVLEPIPGRVLWPDGRVVRDDERQRILRDPQTHHSFLALEEAAWKACEDRVWHPAVRREVEDDQSRPR